MDQDSSFPLTLSYNRLFEIKMKVIFSTNIPIAIKDIFFILFFHSGAENFLLYIQSEC